MPKQKDLKRLIRARMERTGESYTTARAQVLRAGTDDRDLAAIAGMSDEAVRSKTGRDWRGWVRVLDDAGAASRPHREIALLLREEHGVGSWWAQSVTVAYERFRGLRDKGQRRGGGYDVNKSKTVPVGIETLYDAFGARKRARWLGDAKPRIRKATRRKSMRLTWEDGTPVDVYFWEKGPAKSQVQLQHRELPDKAAADRVRAFWTERLAELGRVLRDG
ncbi:MAG: DUF4287 domain-containing protein [Planctomycetota bacterium]